MRTNARLILRSLVFLKQGIPAVTDDISKGYEVGHRWINAAVTPHNEYVLVDSAAGAAVWRQATGVAGTLHSTAVVADLTPIDNIPVIVKMPINYLIPKAIGATGSGTTTLFTLPAGYKITGVDIVKKIADADWTATSLSALTMQIGPHGGTANKYAAAKDIFGTGTLITQSSTVQGIESVTAGTVIDVTWTATGANLSTLTAGDVSVYVTLVKLP